MITNGFKQAKLALSLSELGTAQPQLVSIFQVIISGFLHLALILQNNTLVGNLLVCCCEVTVTDLVVMSVMVLLLVTGMGSVSNGFAGNDSCSDFPKGKTEKNNEVKLKYLLHQSVGEAPPLVEAPLLVNGQGVALACEN